MPESLPCLYCGTENPTSNPICSVCGKSQPDREAIPALLNQAWRLVSLKKVVFLSAAWSILFSLIAMVFGFLALGDSSLNFGLALIGFFLLLSGLAVWGKTSAGGLLVNALSVFALGAWNIGATLVNMRYGVEPGLWGVLGAMQIIWAFLVLIIASQYQRIQHIPSSVVEAAFQLIEKVEGADLKTDTSIFRFRARRRNWQVKVTPYLAIIVPQFGTKVLFSQRSQLSLRPLTTPIPSKKVRVWIVIDDQRWRGKTTYEHWLRWQNLSVFPEPTAEEAPIIEEEPVIEQPPAVSGEAPNKELRQPEASVTLTTVEKPSVHAAAEETSVTVVERPPSQPPAGIRRHPLEVFLYNLSGWGLGQFSMRRFMDGVLYAVGTLLILALAFLNQASSRSFFWIGLLCAWILLGIAHGLWIEHRFSRSSPTDNPPAANRRSLLRAGLILIGEAILVGGYIALGAWNFNTGERFYHQADCLKAISYYDRATNLFELTLSRNIQTADARMDECYLLIYAANQVQAGNFIQAEQVYQTYLDIYSSSPILKSALAGQLALYRAWTESLLLSGSYNQAVEKSLHLKARSPQEDIQTSAELAARVYQEWGDQLAARNDIYPALEKYQALQAQYPDTSYGEKVADLAAEMLLGQAERLGAQGQYPQAETAYNLLLELYPQTKAGLNGEPASVAMYLAWADVVAKNQDYPQAIHCYQIVLNRATDAGLLKQSQEQIASLYANLAQQQQAQGDFSSAIEQYQIVSHFFPETRIAQKVDQQIALVYRDWANHLLKENAYELAIEKFWTLRNYYPRTSQGMAATGRIASTYIGWASYLKKEGQFEGALQKYRLLIDTFPQTLAARQATDAIPQTYLAWAKSLSNQGNYQQALDTLHTLLTFAVPAEVIASTYNAMAETYIAWGQDLQSKGKFRLAIDNLAQAQQVSANPTLLETAKKAFEATVHLLSQDTGEEGKAVVQETLTLACSGEGANSPAIGIKEKDEAARGLMCDANYALPSQLQAVKPAHFLFVILSERGISEWRCPPYYATNCTSWSCPTYTVYRKRHWIKLEIRSTLTGKKVVSTTIYGSYPPACPTRWSGSINSLQNYLIGSEPTDQNILAWLGQTLR